MLTIQRHKADNSRAGFDLTFCAPMSFSLCFANADEKQRECILKAHRTAVMCGLSVYLPKASTLAIIPNDALPADWPGNGALVFLRNEHLENRLGEPFVHTHLHTKDLAGLEAYKKREVADSRYRDALTNCMAALGYAIEGKSAPGTL